MQQKKKRIKRDWVTTTQNPVKWRRLKWKMGQKWVWKTTQKVREKKNEGGKPIKNTHAKCQKGRRENQEGRMGHKRWASLKHTKTQKSRGNNEMMGIWVIQKNWMKNSRKRSGWNEKYWNDEWLKSGWNAMENHQKWQKLSMSPMKISEMKRMK